jgi:NAD(P)-dependent dehydrogenase (short-subunit alcohol dehydrogenase family)
MVRSPLLRAEIAGSAWPPPSASSLTGRRQTELDGAVKSIGENVTGIQGDVAKLSDLDRIYSTVREQKGRLDVLFANAGGGSLVPLGSITEEHFDQIFNTNVRGLLFTVRLPRASKATQPLAYTALPRLRSVPSPGVGRLISKTKEFA